MTQDSSRRLSSVGTTSVDSSRCRLPDSGDSLAAAVTAAHARQAVVKDPVAHSTDQGRRTTGAAGVFIRADAAWQVAGVDVLEAGRLANGRRPQQCLRCCVVGVLHLVVLVEGGHVPGD